MSYQEFLEVAANWSSIATAILAVFAYSKFRYEKYVRRQKLEQYLREEKRKETDKGQRTILNLVANLSMTEAEILAAAFDSKLLKSVTSVDDKGHADGLFFQYDGEDVKPRLPF
jgi:hypothetical protein